MAPSVVVMGRPGRPGPPVAPPLIELLTFEVVF